MILWIFHAHFSPFAHSASNRHSPSRTPQCGKQHISLHSTVEHELYCAVTATSCACMEKCSALWPADFDQDFSKDEREVGLRITHGYDKVS